jgi:hypothetical protein
MLARCTGGASRCAESTTGQVAWSGKDLSKAAKPQAVRWLHAQHMKRDTVAQSGFYKKEPRHFQTI